MQWTKILFQVTIVVALLSLCLYFGLTNIPRAEVPEFWRPFGTEFSGGTWDKLITQMKSVPNSVKKEWEKPVEYQKHKRVVIMDFRGGVTVDDKVFSSFRCPVAQCSFSRNVSVPSLESADAILMRHQFSRPKHRRPPNQLWVLFLMESPLHSPDLTMLRGDINWTATYRLDSTIYVPYGLYRSFDQIAPPQNKTNYALGKKMMAAWVVSHCKTPSGRERYAKDLAKYIQVDIYGQCGTMTCPKDSCFKMLKGKYKFYLSFENSPCHDYITEKLFRNALASGMIPIVMGAPVDDYNKVAPPGSFIHVDNYPSPKALAQYLRKLDQDDQLYNSYFKWKERGVVYPDYTYAFYCRFCAELWSDRQPTWYDDVNDWWRRKGICKYA